MDTTTPEGRKAFLQWCWEEAGRDYDNKYQARLADWNSRSWWYKLHNPKPIYNPNTLPESIALAIYG